MHIFVIANWRRVRYLNDRIKVWDKTIVSDCDKWIYFGDTLPKEEKDNVFHNSCLTYIIKFYNNECERTGKSQISHNIVRTDNCPTQYKCQHNFFKIATS